MRTISSKEAFAILSQDPSSVLVDVRTQLEWNEGVPEVSTLKLLTLTPNKEEFEYSFKNKNLSQDTKILFICRGGVRSGTAADIVEKLGYKECYNISGGFIEWQNANLPARKWKVI